MDISSAHLNRLAALMGDPNEAPSYAKVLLYGDNGCGKSVVAMQIAQRLMENDERGILHVDTSEGHVSLLNHPELIASGVRRIPFTTMHDLRIMGEAMAQKVGIFAHIGAVVLDEFSSMAAADLVRAQDARMGRKDEEAIDAPERPDYNAVLNNVRRTLGAFSNAGVHLIMTAHEKEKKTTNTRGEQRIIGYAPLFFDSVKSEAKREQHVVARLVAKGTKNLEGKNAAPTVVREAQVHAEGGIEAKTKIPFDELKMPSDWLADYIAAWIERGGGRSEEPLPSPQISEPDVEDDVEDFAPIGADL